MRSRKADGPDEKLPSEHELRLLMSELISLREKVAQAELDHRNYRTIQEEEPRQADVR
jgi:hypothetical protein